MHEFEDHDYVMTEFECEICKLPLWQVMPSNMLICLACEDAEPLFLVTP